MRQFRIAFNVWRNRYRVECCDHGGFWKPFDHETHYSKGRAETALKEAVVQHEQDHWEAA